jgi:autotransporter translocation and assembly factor TamB
MRRPLATVVGIACLAASAAALVAQTVPHVDVHLRADRISLEEVARLVPAVRDLELPPELRITRLDAQGPLDRVTVNFDAASEGGAIAGEAVLDLRSADTRARGTIQLRNIVLARLLEQPDLPESLTADARFDLRIVPGGADAGVQVHGTFEVTSPRIAMAGYDARAIRASGRLDGDRLTFDAQAAAYGAALRADGHLTFGSTVAYAVRGSASGVNLARLPRSLAAPRVESNVAATFQVAGTTDGVQGRIVLSESRVAGARLAAGTTATFETRDGLDYRAAGGIMDLDLRRIGEALDVAALDSPRFDSRVQARFEVAAEDGVLQRASVDVADSAIFGGRLHELTVRLTPGGRTVANLAVNGRFEDFDVATLAERPEVDGRVSGTLKAAGAVRRQGSTFDFSTVDAEGSLVLGPSSIQGMALTRGTIAAAVTDGVRLEISQGELAAGETRVEVTGTFGLDPTVATALTYHAETPALDAFAGLIGQPVRGRVVVDGTVKGQRVLQVDGTLAAERLGNQTVRAEALTGRYRAAVPRDDPASARVDARIETRTVTVGAETIGTLNADLLYVDQALTFGVDADQADRALRAAGTLRLQPTPATLQLTALGATMPDAEWSLANGASPTIVYDDEVLKVSGLRLVAAPDQSLAIDGALGAGEAGPLRIDADNVQLAAFAPWIGEPTLRGALDVDADVRGTLDVPEATATFEVTEGLVRGVAYRSLGGRAAYGPETLTFDVRLVQPDESWIGATGTVPSKALTDADARRTAPLDVTVRSSPIDLAIAQTFTDLVSEVNGTMQIDAEIGGTLADPALEGQVVVRQGAFSLPFMGTRYTGLDTTVLLQPGAVVVDQVQLVDDDRDTLVVKGRLPIGESADGSVSLRIEAQSFELIDNAYADLEADLALTVAGQLAQPDVTGTVHLIGGRINADEVLAMTGGLDAYATESARVREATELRVAADRAEPGLLRDVPVQLDVHLTAPALLLAGRDLKGAGDSPVGLGNINLTAAADLQVTKARDAELRVLGEIETVRGTYEFQGREFTLVRGGTIRFDGDEVINPRIDVTAERTISSVRTRVHVRGTVEEPRLELTSRPPLPPSDILALVVFNRPASQLGAGERVSLSRRATALASGFLAGELTEALSDAVGLDLIEIEAGDDAGGATPVVTVGEQLGDFYLRVQQQVGAGSGSRVVLEYDVNDWMRVESSFSDRGDGARTLLQRTDGSGADLVLSWEFGGPKDVEDEAGAVDESPAARRSSVWRFLRPRR